MSCKKGGFVAQRHDTIRDLLTSHISKVCRNVETEPLLQPVDNEVFNLQSTVTRKDIVTVFFKMTPILGALFVRELFVLQGVANFY